MSTIQDLGGNIMVWGLLSISHAASAADNGCGLKSRIDRSSSIAPFLKAKAPCSVLHAVHSKYNLSLQVSHYYYPCMLALG